MHPSELNADEDSTQNRIYAQQQFFDRQAQQQQQSYHSRQQTQHARQQVQFVDQLTPSEQQETDTFEAKKGDESLPWRQSRIQQKIRSRSLQPRDRSLENLPWLRGKREQSLPKQETFLLGRGREPIRPWIEEVIKLKRTELHQKVIERAQLEKVELKESQIERKEIPREELERVDLKCVEYAPETTKYGHVNAQFDGQQGIFGDSGLSMHSLKHEDQITILEITKQIDELIHKDASKAVPWDIQKQQLKTIERAQKMIDRFKVEEVDLKSSRQLLQQEQQLQQQTTSVQHFEHTEDSSILRVDQQMDMKSNKMQVQTSRAKSQQLKQSVQPFSHTEDISILSVAEEAELETRKIENIEQDVPVMWQRGRRQQVSKKGALSYVEDTTILSVKEREEITQRELNLQEQPISWQRGMKHKAGQLSHTDETEILEVEHKTDELPTSVAPWVQAKKTQQADATLQHTEETTLLQVRESQEITQKSTDTDEVPVAWRRGPKPKQGLVQHTEDITRLETQEESIVSVPDKPQVEEKAVPWLRGKKKSITEETPQEVKLKPTPRKSIDETKKPHEMKEVQLKPTRETKPIQKAEIETIETIEPDSVDQEEVSLQPQLPEEPVAVPWKRGQKTKPTEEQVEEKLWPTGKRKPQQPGEVEKVELKPVPRGKPKEPTAPEITELEPVPKVEKELAPQEPEQIVAVPWKRGQKAKPTEEHVEEKQWPKGKRKPQQPEEVGKVELKPVPHEKPKEQVAPEVAELKPVEKELFPEEPEQIEAVPWKRGQKPKPSQEQVEEKQWPKGKRKPQQPEEVEKVELKPVPRGKPKEQPAPEVTELEPVPKVERELVPEEPEQIEAVPWKRGQKPKPTEEKVEEKQWPKGKRKPQQPEEVEKVELKPVPRGKPKEPTAPEVTELEPVPKVEKELPTDQPEEEVPVPWKRGEKKKKLIEKKPEVQTPLILDEALQKEEVVATEEISSLVVAEDITETAIEIEDSILPKAKKTKPVIKPPRFTRKLQPEVCQPNQPCELRAIVDGSPFPEVKWLFNDVELLASETYEMNVVEKVVSLKIAKVTASCVGIYTCELRNQAGVAISRTNIALGKPQIYFEFIIIVSKLIWN